MQVDINQKKILLEEVTHALQAASVVFSFWGGRRIFRLADQTEVRLNDIVAAAILGLKI